MTAYPSPGLWKLAAASAVFGTVLFAASFVPLFAGHGPLLFGLAVAAQLAIAVAAISARRAPPAHDPEALAAAHAQIAEMRRDMAAFRTESEAQQERFTYIVSHDLRSPLLTMQGFSDILKLDLEEKNFEAVEEDLDHILKATQRMRLLLDDLLELSRIGRFNEPAEETPISEVISAAVDEIRELVDEKGAHIDIAAPPGDLPTLRVDRQRIQQLYRNLLDNAVRYGNDGEPPRIQVGVRPGGELFVADNGTGLEKEQLESAFGPFERFSAESVGSGMGLAHAQRIVDYHRGTIRAESQGPGRGTTIVFTLNEPEQSSPEGSASTSNPE